MSVVQSRCGVSAQVFSRSSYAVRYCRSASRPSAVVALLNHIRGSSMRIELGHQLGLAAQIHAPWRTTPRCRVAFSSRDGALPPVSCITPERPSPTPATGSEPSIEEKKPWFGVPVGSSDLGGLGAPGS